MSNIVSDIAQHSQKVADLTDGFTNDFGRLKINVESKMENSSSISQDQLPMHFNKIKQDLQELQKFLSESTKFLPSFNVKVALNYIKLLEDRLESEQIKLIPKKKFAFKTKNRKEETMKHVQDLNPPGISVDLHQLKSLGKDVPDSVAITGSKRAIAAKLHFLGFKNLRNEIAKKLSPEISGKDVSLSNSIDSTIYLYGYPSTVHISGLKNCQIYTGPVTTSVFIEDCNHCTFFVACQQLRVHSTLNCDFHLHVTSRGIIEDSKGLRFAPYNWKYQDLDNDFERSGLGHDNNWQQIDDFNWLSKEAPSPNWCVFEGGPTIRIGDAV